jgi:hypothetical protein
VVRLDAAPGEVENGLSLNELVAEWHARKIGQLP